MFWLPSNSKVLFRYSWQMTRFCTLFIFKNHDFRFNVLLVYRSFKMPEIATLFHCVPFLKYLGRKPMRNLKLNVFQMRDCFMEAGLGLRVLEYQEGEHSKPEGLALAAPASPSASQLKTHSLEDPSFSSSRCTSVFSLLKKISSLFRSQDNILGKKAHNYFSSFLSDFLMSFSTCHVLFRITVYFSCFFLI